MFKPVKSVESGNVVKDGWTCNRTNFFNCFLKYKFFVS